jgi:hypothetical protein
VLARQGYRALSRARQLLNDTSPEGARQPELQP